MGEWITEWFKELLIWFVGFIFFIGTVVAFAFWYTCHSQEKIESDKEITPIIKITQEDTIKDTTFIYIKLLE